MSPESDCSLEGYRNYLRVLAGLHLSPMLRRKVDASDVVQEALIKAHRHRDQFKGRTQAERAAWLRRILANTLADLHRSFGRGKRELGLEQSLEDALDRSSLCLGKILADERAAPEDEEAIASRHLHLSEALARLPESQRSAVTLRYLYDPPCSLLEIARRLERTEKAAAGLVCRGLETLRKILREVEES
jgi:RNA polymerase sigma-70 factor (ECF subfamily)